MKKVTVLKQDTFETYNNFMETTYKTNICKHLNQLVNQGCWWCNLKDENGKQKHPHCDCENCPDKQEITYVTDTSSSLNIDQTI